MKVIGQQPAVLQDIKGGQRKEADQAHLKDGPPLADDSVKTASFVMDKLKLRISAEPEIRSDKVTELKAQIKSGEYQVDSQKLASNMLLESLREDIV
jgi:flagellar biosynthesis anti-sigma factor FlgM